MTDHSTTLDELRERARHHGPVTRAELATLNRAGESELVASYAQHRHQITDGKPARPPARDTPSREPIRFLTPDDM